MAEKTASTASVTVTEDTSIRPFRVEVPQADLDDLRRRIASPRWPDQETVSDRSQGVQLAKLRPLVEYWGTDYEWLSGRRGVSGRPRRRILGSSSR